MSNDYTLPPLGRDTLMACVRDLGLTTWAQTDKVVCAISPAVLEYGHACAEHARAPLVEENARLLARIAELEAENQTLTRECSGAEDESGRLEEELQKEHDENDRLRAEVDALTAANAALVASNDALRSALSQCATAVGASALSTCSVEFLACIPREVELVVEKYKAHAERYAHLKSIAKLGINKRQDFVITLDLVPCPGHIGMLDLALDADRNYNKEPTPE